MPSKPEAFLTKTVRPHPIQPLVKVDGVVRFKKNAIVDFLLNAYAPGMNELARMDFSSEDWCQFRQLIGYSHSGIPNCPEEIWQAAEAMYKAGVSEQEARANHLREELDAAKAGMREAIARLYGVHPDNLGEDA